MGGLLSQMVGLKFEKDKQALTGAIEGAKTILSSPTSSPEAQQWAIRSIVSLTGPVLDGGGGKSKGGGAGTSAGSGKGGGISHFFGELLTGLAGGRPNQPHRDVQQAVSQAQAGRPPIEKMTLTPEEQSQLKNRQLAIESQETLRQEEALAQQQRKRELLQGQEDWEMWSKRGKELGLTGRDLAEYAGTKGQRIPTQSTGASRVVYGKIKGQEDQGTQPLSFNPRDPEGYIDVNGRSYTKEEVELTGPPAPADRLFGQSLVISKIVEGEGYKRGTPEYDQRFGEIASTYIGTALGRTQQQIAIDEYRSGIGAGQGVPPSRTPLPAAAGTTAAPKTTAPATTGTPTTTTAPTSTAPVPSSTPGTAATTASSAPAGKDRFISMYIDSLFGNIPSGGGGADKVGIIKGREELLKRSGLDPATFAVIAAENKNFLKSIAETVMREAAVQRVNETLNQFGEELLLRANEVLQTGSPVLNKPIRSLTTLTVGNPDLRKFMIALNGFQRQYSTLTAGGALSRAMLPVSVGEKVDEIIGANMTLGETIALVQQVKREGQREAAGFKDARNIWKQQVVQGPLGPGGGRGGSGRGAGSGTAAPSRTATGPNGEKLGLVNGQWVPIP
jgi:hypothetical protein